MRLRFVLALFLLTAGAAYAAAQANSQMPEIKVRRLSPRAAIVDLDPSGFSTAVVAVAAKQGLVVIEAPGNLNVGKAIREAIQTEFKRSDFAWLLYTHQHHTGGAAAFADVPAVGQEWVRKLLVAAGRTAPDVTFDRQMTLYLGDVTARLVYYGQSHTPGDTIISIPEENLVVTGSLFFPGQIPMLGARGKPVPRGEVESPVPPKRETIENWLVILRGLVDDADSRTQFIPGHGLETMNKAYMQQTLAYLQKLWTEVRRAKAEGKTLEQTQADLTFKARFPELADRQDAIWAGTQYEIRGVHQTNVEFLWRVLD
jgi:cyclase